VSFALGCFAAILLSVVVYRRLNVTSWSNKDVTDILRDIETTNGLNVLGDPKSDEVIARLIEFMNEPESENATKEYWNAAMEALAKIGGPAVPKLMEAIQGAPNKAASKRFADGTGLSDFGIRVETSKIQTRAAMVLGRIGDARALPVLKALRSDNGVMLYYVNEAIERIEKANDRAPRPSAGQASSDAEMYEVYSAAIKQLYLGRGEKVKSGAPGAEAEQLVVIRDRTIIYGTPGSDSVAAWRTGGFSVDDETIDDFRLKYDAVVSLEPRFTVKHTLIGDRESEGFFGKGGRSWPAFYRRYRTSIGYIVLSRIGFNRDHSQALLYTEKACGPGCGEGCYVILGKQGDAWSVKHTVALWVA